MLRVPYICFSDNESIADVPGSDALKAHGRWLTAANHDPGDPEIEALAQSLADARDPGSDLTAYYRRAQAEYRLPANEQMSLAFATLQNNPSLT